MGPGYVESQKFASVGMANLSVQTIISCSPTNFYQLNREFHAEMKRFSWIRHLWEKAEEVSNWPTSRNLSEKQIAFRKIIYAYAYDEEYIGQFNRSSAQFRQGREVF